MSFDYQKAFKTIKSNNMSWATYFLDQYCLDITEAIQIKDIIYPRVNNI